MTDSDGLEPRIAWGLTGAGHFLSSSIKMLLTMQKVDIFLSKAAKEVLMYYDLFDRLKASGHSIYFDESASCLPVSKLYTGKYDLVVIAPVTSNTIAKMAHGIADNLISNLFAHAGKCRVPTILLPCDWRAEIQSTTPQGRMVSVFVRAVDRENIACLANWDMVTLVNSPGELMRHLK
ncbi:MAG: flavoprotein [Peptococcaceae bacterium]|nr:flavoprotein [Peptococcaceae bacterium]